MKMNDIVIETPEEKARRRCSRHLFPRDAASVAGLRTRCTAARLAGVGADRAGAGRSDVAGGRGRGAGAAIAAGAVVGVGCAAVVGLAAVGGVAITGDGRYVGHAAAEHGGRAESSRGDARGGVEAGPGDAGHGVVSADAQRGGVVALRDGDTGVFLDAVYLRADVGKGHNQAANVTDGLP